VDVRPRLRVVDEQGEVHDGCPGCEEAERTLVQYEKDIRILKAKITKLERDTETECRADPLWPEAECLHEWWRLATGHLKARFDSEDFLLARRHLKREGLVGCLQAVCGAAYDAGTDELKNGREKRFDDFELIFRNKAKMESFAERVPGEEGDDRQWRIWLAQRIESNLR
jgi:hypothetical protein